MKSPYMTVPEAAKYLRISRISMYKLLEKGKIKAQKAGRLWRITMNDLKQYMERSK